MSGCLKWERYQPLEIIYRLFDNLSAMLIALLIAQMAIKIFILNFAEQLSHESF